MILTRTYESEANALRKGPWLRNRQIGRGYEGICVSRLGIRANESVQVWNGDPKNTARTKDPMCFCKERQDLHLVQIPNHVGGVESVHRGVWTRKASSIRPLDLTTPGEGDESDLWRLKNAETCGKRGQPGPRGKTQSKRVVEIPPTRRRCLTATNVQSHQAPYAEST